MMENKKRLSKTDLAAFLLLAGLFTALFLFANRGIGYRDETYYYAIVQRVMQGDRLLVDEWHLIQLASFLLILPYKLALTICDGTDGVILTLRYLFLAYRAVYSVWVWHKLRRFGAAGLVSTVLYFAYANLNLATFSYNTLSQDGVLAIGLILFLSEKLSVGRCISLGVLIGLVVIAEPVFVLAFCFYVTIVFLLRFSKRLQLRFDADLKNIFSCKTLLLLIAGVFAVAVPFLFFLLRGSNVSLILNNVRVILSDPDYRLINYFGSGKPRILIKSEHLFSCIGIGAVSVYCVLFVCVVFRKKIWKRIRLRTSAKYVLFAFSCGLLFAVYLRLIHLVGTEEEFHIYLFSPMLPFSLLFYLLCEEKSTKALGFIIVGVLYSACVDFSSGVWLWIGGLIAQIGGCLSVAQLFNEYRHGFQQAEIAHHTGDNRRLLLKTESTVACVVCICLSGVFLFGTVSCAETCYFVRQSFCPQMEKNFKKPDECLSAEQTITLGPHKGIRTIAVIRSSYENMLEDIETIRAVSEGPLYVYGYHPEVYLHANMIYSCHSVYALSEDFSRQLLYWRLYPKRIPAYIYIPSALYYRDASELSLKNKLELLSTVFTYRMKPGAGGYILEILSVHTEQSKEA